MYKCIYTNVCTYIHNVAWNQRPRNSRRDSARARRRLRARCSAYSSPPLRVHTPVLQRAGQACACAYCVCAWPGARVRPLSDLEPPRSSREPLPASLLSSRPMRNISLPYHRCRNCSLSVFLCRALSLPLPFAFLCSKRHAVSDGLETRSELIDRECWIFGLHRRES